MNLKGIQPQEDGRLKLTATAICPTTGKRVFRRRFLPASTTIAEAVAAREQLVATLHEELAPCVEETPALEETMTLRAYAERWLEAKAAVTGEHTSRKYLSHLSHHILPHLGDVFCSALRREDVQVWCDQAKQARMDCGELYSRDTLMSWWGTLSEVLRDMAADLHLADPTLRVRPPLVKRSPKRERRTLTREQLHRLVELAEEVCPTRYAEIITLAYTGMRSGELYGLQWDDVDEDAEALHIRRSFSDGVITEGGKTGVGRAAYMHPKVTEAIRQHRRRLIADQHPGVRTPWVFTTDDGAPRYRGSLAKRFVALSTLMELDFTITPQVLRRTFNTLLQQAQVDTLVLWSQMGHSSEAMTAHYTHVSHDRKRQAVLQVFTTQEVAQG